LFSAFVVEVVLTFFLVFTVLGSTDVKAPVGFAGLPSGLVLIHLVGIPVTNTSVIPPEALAKLYSWEVGRWDNCGCLSSLQYWKR
jgi:glycerol uptake facilitator-like aquaporin